MNAAALHALATDLARREGEGAVAGHLRDARERDEQRLGANVAVHERAAVVVASQMRVMNAGARVDDDARRDARGDGLRQVQHTAQRLTVGELHDAGVLLLEVGEPEDGDDVGVIELRGVLRLAADLREQGAVLLCLVGHEDDHARICPTVVEDGETQLRARAFPRMQWPKYLVPDRPHGTDRRR